MSDDLLERIAIVKAKWSVPELVESLTGEPIPSSRKVHSLFNESDSTPSMHLYDDSFYCYSTGKYGDVVDLIRFVKHCTVERAVQILEAEADDLGLVATVRTVAPKPPFAMPLIAFWRVYDERCPPMAPPAGVTHGLFASLFNHDRIGIYNKDDLAIVHYDPGAFDYVTCKPKPVGVKYRGKDGRKWSEPGSDFSSFLYQPFAYSQGNEQTRCVITEGETDSWAWLSVRPVDHVYALPSGAQSWKDKFLSQLERYDKVYICFDQDHAGVMARDNVTRAVGWGRAEWVQLPCGVKDVRDAVAQGWSPTLKTDTGKYRDSNA